MAGRPRTPSNVLELKGAFAKNPNRRRDGEPASNGEVGKPPEHMTEGQKACWNEIVETCAADVLQKSDRLALEMAAVLLEQFRGAGGLVHPTILLRLQGLLGTFGMTPADRSKVVVPKQEKANEFAKFGKKRGD